MRALTAAALVVTATVVLLTVRLAGQSSPDVAVDWLGWAFAVVSAYAGLGMLGWWLRDRERGRAPRPVPKD